MTGVYSQPVSQQIQKIMNSECNFAGVLLFKFLFIDFRERREGRGGKWGREREKGLTCSTQAFIGCFLYVVSPDRRLNVQPWHVGATL